MKIKVSHTKFFGLFYCISLLAACNHGESDPVMPESLFVLNDTGLTKYTDTQNPPRSLYDEEPVDYPGQEITLTNKAWSSTPTRMYRRMLKLLKSIQIAWTLDLEKNRESRRWSLLRKGLKRVCALECYGSPSRLFDLRFPTRSTPIANRSRSPI